MAGLLLVISANQICRISGNSFRAVTRQVCGSGLQPFTCIAMGSSISMTSDPGAVAPMARPSRSKVTSSAGKSWVTAGPKDDELAGQKLSAAFAAKAPTPRQPRRCLGFQEPLELCRRKLSEMKDQVSRRQYLAQTEWALSDAQKQLGRLSDDAAREIVSSEIQLHLRMRELILHVIDREDVSRALSWEDGVDLGRDSPVNSFAVQASVEAEADLTRVDSQPQVQPLEGASIEEEVSKRFDEIMRLHELELRKCIAPAGLLTYLDLLQQLHLQAEERLARESEELLALEKAVAKEALKLQETHEKIRQTDALIASLTSRHAENTGNNASLQSKILHYRGNRALLAGLATTAQGRHDELFESCGSRRRLCALSEASLRALSAAHAHVHLILGQQGGAVGFVGRQ